ncbi:alanine racemase [Actinoallomurus sp. NBC_01490]|jgi:D-serine deaminase-like pyridoxal phosphate-dependent protein|uniref:alanine racemase n=1 Tax=Actinoallomurus sp. NBC_01490 TaxID=2903557 RepID=UPI002E31F6CE|nr:alanine racemase [Actinoallomurus sp. NBC_01490]
MPIPELDTPALVVDVDRLETNLARMAGRAEAAGIDLTPHAKTHKCVPLARRQLAHGARGLTVATLDEAELFADGGCDRLFIAYPCWAGGDRAARLRALHERVELRVGVDSVAGADQLAAAIRGADHSLTVLIEVDCGGRRSGVTPDQIRDLVTHCLRIGLDVAGAFCHPGHAYTSPGQVPGAAADERAALTTAGAVLTWLLDRPPVLSGGSTPTALDGLAHPLTEVRPGTYVFGDRQQMHLAAVPEDEIALVVATRVVSVPRAGEAVLDAGSKALSSDRPAWLTGHGWIAEAPEATVAALTEEHAVVRGLRRPPAVGDLVRVVPNHVCTAVNLGREITVVSDGKIVDMWPVGPGARR